jgi:hypothetical protein
LIYNPFSVEGNSGNTVIFVSVKYKYSTGESTIFGIELIAVLLTLISTKEGGVIAGNVVILVPDTSNAANEGGNGGNIDTSVLLIYNVCKLGIALRSGNDMTCVLDISIYSSVGGICENPVIPVSLPLNIRALG